MKRSSQSLDPMMTFVAVALLVASVSTFLTLRERTWDVLGLSAFEWVWDALIPTEQARVLGPLTERIAYDGRTQTLDLAFTPSGIGRLHELQTS
jgi:hypothetical protein